MSSVDGGDDSLEERYVPIYVCTYVTDRSLVTMSNDNMKKTDFVNFSN
jgi:hypothetical protein